MKFKSIAHFKEFLDDNCFSLLSFNKSIETYICDKVKVLIILDDFNERVIVSYIDEKNSSSFDLYELDEHSLRDLIETKKGK